jgi:chromosome partitioning protein
MKIFATYNIKGGVGKTAAAVNLAYLSARDGNKTLIWDLDPQGSATYYFRIKPKIKGGGKGLIGKKDIDERIKGTDYEGLDLLPADFSYRNMDLILNDTKDPTHQLLKLLRPVAEEYDHVFLDCPPSISLVSENVFQIAEALLVPIIPSTLSQLTFEQLLYFCKKNNLKHLKLIPFFSMVDRRKSLHLETVRNLSKEHKIILKTHIPYASDVERMGVYRAPVAIFSDKKFAALAYESLWEEIKANIA